MVHSLGRTHTYVAEDSLIRCIFLRKCSYVSQVQFEPTYLCYNSSIEMYCFSSHGLLNCQKKLILNKKVPKGKGLPDSCWPQVHISLL